MSNREALTIRVIHCGTLQFTTLTLSVRGSEHTQVRNDFQPSSRIPICRNTRAGPELMRFSPKLLRHNWLALVNRRHEPTYALLCPTKHSPNPGCVGKQLPLSALLDTYTKWLV